jgi:hypothetical protein
MQRLIAPILTIVIASACGWGTSAQYSLGPYRMDADALYDRTVRTITAEGYRVQSSDPARGTLVVRANYRHPAYDEAHEFTIQCYREGWIQLTASGPLVRRQREELVMPKPLVAEYQALAIRLGASFRALGDAS